MDIELITLPNDPNAMIRLNSSSTITSHSLKEIQAECLRRFKTSSHTVKAKWHRMGCFAEAILMGKSIPYSGLAVIGPFVGRDVTFPEPGEILSLNVGIEVYSNMPELLGKTHIERKPRQIRLAEMTAGYVNLHNKGEIVDPMVYWSLHAGYSGWTSIKNVKERGVSYSELKKQG